jgi:CRISPR-associated protein Cmr4
MLLSNLIILKCITNLHVGSENLMTSIVDKPVQKDLLTNYPKINASSLKGALREDYDGEAKNDIFGNDTNRGQIIFFDSKILFYPFRTSKYKKPYILVTSKSILKEFFYDLNINSVDNKNLNNFLTSFENLLTENGENLLIENLEISKYWNISDIDSLKFLPSDLTENCFIIDDENFNYLIEDIPVIARNKIENGQSANLWYEEYIPRETIFYTFLSSIKDSNNSKNSDENTQLKKFINYYKNRIFQLGANSTIGYGYIKFYNIADDSNE